MKDTRQVPTMAVLMAMVWFLVRLGVMGFFSSWLAMRERVGKL